MTTRKGLLVAAEAQRPSGAASAVLAALLGELLVECEAAAITCVCVCAVVVEAAHQHVDWFCVYHKTNTLICHFHSIGHLEWLQHDRNV